MSEHRHPPRLFAGLRESAGSTRRALERIRADVRVWADVRAFPPLAVIAALDCVAGLVLWRKLYGGPALLLTNVRLCVAGFAVAALAITGRWWLARIERKPPSVWIRTILMMLGVLPMLTLLSLANSHHSPWAVSFVSALAVVSSGAILLWNRLSSAPPAADSPLAPSAVTLTFPLRAIAPAVADPKGSSQNAPTTAPLAQFDSDSDAWMERTIDGSGIVQLKGSVHAEFAAGQTIATVHIPFSPAFDRIPDFSCEVVDAASIRARSPAVYRYGARVELKRASDASSPTRAEIRYQARATAEASRAA